MSPLPLNSSSILKHEHSNSQVNLKSESDDLVAIRDEEQQRIASAFSSSKVQDNRISTRPNDEDENLIDQNLFKFEHLSKKNSH